MINLIKSLLAGLLVAALFKLTFVDSLWGLILPFLITAIGLFIFLARRSARTLEALVQKVQIDLQTLSPTSPPSERQAAMDKAVETLKGGLAIGRDQFLVNSQLHAQIGQIYYVQQRFKEARPHLEKSFSRIWIARAMFACILFKDKEYAQMKKVFEETVKHSDKESLLWNLYAWCVWKSGDRDSAQIILDRAVRALPKDEKLKKNADNLKNNNQIKMRGWKEMWYQFHLEPIPQQDLQRLYLEQREAALRQQQGQAKPKMSLTKGAIRGR
jgi:tetratricopeptide (TPR) repeat protein